MHRSENRILTTHVGSLPRPAALSDLFPRGAPIHGQSMNR